MNDGPHDKIPTTIDEMINENFYVKRFSGRPSPIDTSIHEVETWLDENVSCFIHDSGPRYLAERFAQMHLEYTAQDHEFPYCPPRGREMPDLEPTCGEIEWRTLHVDETVPCDECGKGINNETGESWCTTPHSITIEVD